MAGLAFGVGISLDSAPEALLEEAELLRGTVVLYDQAGHIVASSGTGPTKLIRAEIANHPAQRQALHHRSLARDYRADHHRHRAPLIGGRLPPALRGARVGGTRVGSRAPPDRDDRALARLHPGRRPPAPSRAVELARGGQSDNAYAWDRLKRYGFRHGTGVRLLVLTDSRWSGPRTEEFNEVEGFERVTSLETAASGCGLRLLLAAPRKDRVIGLTESDDAAQQRWITGLANTIHCVLSFSFYDLATGTSRLSEAETAHSAAVREQHPAVLFDHIGLFDWLITGHDPSSARAKAQQQLAPIADNASVMGALTEYFRCGGEIQPTARQLGLHPNSVRHRLKRAG